MKARIEPEVEAAIVSYIRAGAFPHVAAEAAGVTRELFQTLLAKGKSKKSKLHEFYKKIMQARAQARLLAEKQVHDEDPKCWLRSGPGRETTEDQGWTSIVRPQMIAANSPGAIFASQEFMHFMMVLRTALANYPEALQALSEAMNEVPSQQRVKRLSRVEPIVDLEDPPKPIEEITVYEGTDDQATVHRIDLEGHQAP